MSTEAPLWWEDGALCLIDQTALPHDFRSRRCTTWEEVAEAIRALRVRGAPAIGLAAAYGLALAGRAATGSRAEQLARLRLAASGLRAARPTAVNLAWALERMLAAAEATPEAERLPGRLLEEAQAMARADLEMNRRMAAHGAALLPHGASVLTYCNTGMLATGGWGTAFGVLRQAHDEGRRIRVIVCETRPVLQGARLTAWELVQHGIPATLITDNAAATLMRAGEVDAVIVGADRIAANGDTANKVGTYALAVLAHAHGLPFFVAAPLSTVDLATPEGTVIPIEERSADEVTMLGGTRVAAPGIAVRNPAFDVTPHRLITAIVTESGVLRPPYTVTLRAALEGAAAGAAR
ncbi:MAG TPA: S-methyl-5-thioribose-1-phosphate isomerase [bacterium]|nr:S-methyl-5-thioribose-1-phosphate isomerase [bacterium]